MHFAEERCLRTKHISNIEGNRFVQEMEINCVEWWGIVKPPHKSSQGLTAVHDFQTLFYQFMATAMILNDHTLLWKHNDCS